MPMRCTSIHLPHLLASPEMRLAVLDFYVSYAHNIAFNRSSLPSLIDNTSLGQLRPESAIGLKVVHVGHLAQPLHALA